MTAIPATKIPALPATMADSGKIRLGAGFGVLPPVAPPAELRDTGAIRLGAGFGLLPPTAR